MNDKWDQHWNTLCLGIVTLSMATVGAAFFAGGFADIDLSSNDLRINILQAIKVVSIFFVLAVLIRLVFASSRAIFTSSQDLRREGTTKRAQTAYVFVGFTLIVMALVALLLIDVFALLAASLD